MIRNFIKKITHPFLRKISGYYSSKPRKYSYKNVSVMVHPEVFPPHHTLSTKILLNYISQLDIHKKTFLELGCGSGIISLFAASKGAHVSASDINPIALEYLEKAAKKNHLELDIIQSDLFLNIPQTSFDFICINPPYYPKKPKNIKEQAWFCGENFEYFEKLFQQLPGYIHKNQVLMILSEDCDLQHIQHIAKQHQLNFQLVLEKKRFFEKNYIFKIESL